MGIGSSKLPVNHDHPWEVGIDRTGIAGGIHMEDARTWNSDTDRAGVGLKLIGSCLAY